MPAKIIARSSFLGLGYIVREGESYIDGATRAVKRCYGKGAFLDRCHSPCQAGPWRVQVLTRAKGGGYDVHGGAWEHAEFFSGPASNRPVEDES